MMFTDIKIEYIKWYDYLWLWLARTRRVWDMKDGSVLIYKMWWGKIYVLGCYGRNFENQKIFRTEMMKRVREKEDKKCQR